MKVAGTVRRPDLEPLLNARSVAIVGASQLPHFGGWVDANLRAYGYPGRIYSVNPRYGSLNDQPCYPSLRDLPERPDCAILALPNERLAPAMQDAVELKVPAAVIFASAYSAPVEGRPALQTCLAEMASANGLAVCGPNCMGFHAFVNRLVVSGYPLTPGTPSGNVTFITHSGSAFEALWQNQRGVHFNYVISPGNEMVITLADYMLFALADPTTRAIALFLETVRDPAMFQAALQEAAERDIPVVALKLGRTAEGARFAFAHSGALAGEDAAYDALFKYYGVCRVRSLDEMLDTLELFAAGLRPPTRYIASLHDSGGERGLLVDLAAAESVSFAPISGETKARLAATLDPGLDPSNPLDAWGTGNDVARIYRDSLLALDADAATGLSVFAVDLYPSDAEDSTYLDVALEIKPRLKKPLVFLSNVAASLGSQQSARLRQNGVPVLMGTENGLRAIRHLLEYREFQRQRASANAQPQASPAEHPYRGADEVVAVLRRVLRQATGPLDEFTSQEFLQAYGIPIATRAIADSCAEALEAAERIGYPVALKTAMGQAHKSDQGGVQLGLPDARSLAAAYRALTDRFGPRVLVQQMIPAGVELILGLVNDPQFGPMLALGLGGLFVEVLNDSRLVLLPTTREAVREAWLSLRGAALLMGARGRPAVDLEAVIDATSRLAAFAADLGDLIRAMDINPLIVSATGVVAVDALIVPSTER